MSKVQQKQVRNEECLKKVGVEESSDSKIIENLKIQENSINPIQNNFSGESIKKPLKKIEQNIELEKLSSVNEIITNKNITLKEIRNEIISISDNKNQKRSVSIKKNVENIIKHSKITNIKIGTKKKDTTNNEIINNSEKRKINEKMINIKIEQKVNYKEILNDINILLNKNVTTEKIVNCEYFTENDFQIMNKKEASKLPFIINLFNYINILNSIYVYANKDIELFHNLLILINSKFSYVERSDKKNLFDFGFLTNVSSIIIPYIISKGETGFKIEELNKMSKKYCELIKTNNTEYGYLYESSNKGFLINEIEENNYIEYPDIIYYLNTKGVQKLYKDKIFNVPNNYILEDQKKVGEFSGFNEFDICFKVNHYTKIEENNQFKIIKLKDGNIVKNFDLKNKNDIEFYPDIIYLIEVKRNANELCTKEKLDKILIRKNTFIQLYNNTVYNKLNIEKNMKYELLFIFDGKRQRAVEIASEQNIKDSVFFSNPSISLNVIVCLNRNIYELNIKNNTLKKDIDLLKEDKKEKDKKIKNLEQNIKNLEEDKKEKDKKIKSHENEINSLKEQVKQLTQMFNSFNNNNLNLNNSIDSNITNLQNSKLTYSRLINIS